MHLVLGLVGLYRVVVVGRPGLGISVHPLEESAIQGGSRAAMLAEPDLQ
jgi:hypothetical protein